MEVVAVVAAAGEAVVVANLLLRMRSPLKRLQAIAEYKFPFSYKVKLEKQLNKNLTNEEFRLVSWALLEYFQCCYLAKRKIVAMPSYVADELWHIFILDTQKYAAFCREKMGYFLHHIPSEENSKPNKIEMGRAWVNSLYVENSTEGKIMPLIFSIDKTINVPEGNFWFFTKEERLNHSHPQVRTASIEEAF